MTPTQNKFKTPQRIDFGKLNDVLGSNAEALVSMWLPGGHRDGHEWRCGSLDGDAGDSFAVHIGGGKKHGRWSDFATGETGGDWVSLHAAVFHKTQIESARELWLEFGLGTATPVQLPKPAHAQAGGGVESSKADKRRSDWTAIYPVPDYAPTPPAAHSHRGIPAITWTYRRDGKLLGHVCRFVTSDGGKEVIPLTWCVNGHDPHTPGAARWHWKSWDSPRPLYLPAGALRPGVMKVIPEGEKCADALHRIMDEFDSLSWPGGGKAVNLADWTWIAGEKVILWPDTDSHRRRLTDEEKRQNVDPDTVDFLPLEKQPGHAAMLKLANILHLLGCEVWIVPFIEPGTKPDGWDVADAVAGLGVDTPWTSDDVRAYLRTAKRWQPPADVINEAAKVLARQSAPPPTDWSLSEDGEPVVISGWPHFSKSQPKATRENVLHAFRLDPALTGLVGLNEFSHQICKLKATPWPSQPGVWLEVDDYKLAEYLVLRHNWGQSPSGESITQAMKVIAQDHAFHPVRDRLLALAWDKSMRLDSWLFEALSLNPDAMPARKAKYIAHVGRWFMMGMVARVLRPGSKFDYMLVLEGPQGYRKSTLGKVLAGEYFSDTHLDLGNKDSYLQLQGRWVHEFSELHAITGKDVTLVKAFISSTTDYLRAPFDRRPAEYQRQCVFYGTSNNAKWARDRTGNRRFWPVEVITPVQTEWVAENLDQLFAEAVCRVQAGERYYPTHTEEIAWFAPEQAKRVQATSTEEALMQFLCGTRNSKGSTDVPAPEHVTLISCLEGIGIDVAKSASNRMVQSEVIELLHKWGWTHKKSTRVISGKRPWVYVRPSVWPPADPLDDDELTENASSTASADEEDADVPF